MKILKLDIKKILYVKKACTKEESKYILQSVHIRDIKTKDNKCYRDYIGCDGKIFLLIREPIEQIEIENDGINIFFNKIDLPLKIRKLNHIYADFEVNTDMFINREFNIVFNIDRESIYPNFDKIIPISVIETNYQVVIDSKYLDISKNFFDSIKEKVDYYKFYTAYNGNNKNGFRQVKLQIQQNKDIIKLLLVMEIDSVYLADLKTTNNLLKEFTR